MWQLFKRCLRKLDAWRFQYGLKDALALHRRGEVRSDGLKLENVCSRLEICWRARDVHPWDRDRLSIYEKATAFAEQALADTEAAILRLFERLPHVDIIEIRVLEPASDTLIAAGTVHRVDLNAGRHPLLSVRMRLGKMGVRYHFGLPETSDSTAHSVIADFCTR